jgi:hypothetical protein
MVDIKKIRKAFLRGDPSGLAPDEIKLYQQMKEGSDGNEEAVERERKKEEKREEKKEEKKKQMRKKMEMTKKELKEARTRYETTICRRRYQERKRRLRAKNRFGNQFDNFEFG